MLLCGLRWPRWHHHGLLQRWLVTLNAAPVPVNEGGQLLRNFVANKIDADLASGKNDGRVVTRFPPEPNGYLHLGHAKSICINFGLARHYNGITHMRFDDTNPAKEDMKYVTSILNDVRWLVGLSGDKEPWHGPVRHASDYFLTFYAAAEVLIRKGLAYVDHQSSHELQQSRGSLTVAGTPSPYRSRSVDENLALFADMRNGKVGEGECVLRAKIDMASSNMNMRDPTLYRVKRVPHPMTGDEWVIYPMYDFAHALSDAIEGVTHSLCTLEFEDHRPLYDWVIDNVTGSGLLLGEDLGWRSVQTEFARLNVQYTVLSKRKLIQLVEGGHVDGWDDPRMPTLVGLRKRGYPAEAIWSFCDRLGVSKVENNIDISILEDCVRESLDHSSPRALAVLQPLRVIITNWAEENTELFDVPLHPKRPEMGSRNIPFSRVIYIDRDDFHDSGEKNDIPPPVGFKRLILGGTARLKFAYVIRCDEVVRGTGGDIIELRCSYDPSTRAGSSSKDSMQAKGIIQWVAHDYGVSFEATLFDRLFLAETPGKAHPDGDFLRDLNPHSMVKHTAALAEPYIADTTPGDAFQFERLGYFCRDSDSKSIGAPRFHRIVTLRDTWQREVIDGKSNAKLKAKLSEEESALSAETVAIPDILRVDMRVGRILSASTHPAADNLYCEQIDVGEEQPRTVISGLAGHIPLDSLPGRLVVVLCNLKPSKMRGIVSEGMLLAASDGSTVELVEPPASSVTGEAIRVDGFGEPRPDEQLKSKSAQKVWQRVAAGLQTNSKSEATFAGCSLRTTSGLCTVASLKNVPIR